MQNSQLVAPIESGDSSMRSGEECSSTNGKGMLVRHERRSSTENDDAYELSRFTSSSLLSNSTSASTALRNSRNSRNSTTASLSPNPRKTNQLELTIDKLNFEALELYGREEELKLLKTCLDQASTGSADRQLVLISGYSGTGKTTLADSLKSQVNTLGGLYVRGKFDVNARSEPYAGIVTACTVIWSHISTLRSRTPGVFERVCKRIKEDLGSELSLLIQFIPEMRDLLDADSLVKEAIFSSEEAKNRFHFALQRFVRIISTECPPLVLALDDLQWADAPSLDLTNALLSDQKTTHLIVLGIYRSNEVSDSHIFNHTLEEFKIRNTEGLFKMAEIDIGNLDVVAVDRMIGDLLSMDKSERTMELAEVCFKRTHGNAFFLLHFLLTLHEHKLLRLNYALMAWTWDIDEIISDTSISDNVVDILRQKMVSLPPILITIMKVGACLGFTFEERLMRIVLENMSSELSFKGECAEVLKEGLYELEEYGYVHRLSTPQSTTSTWTFTWAHDKIHETAASLAEDEDECSAFRYRVGHVLASRMDQCDLDSAIFVVTNLLNEGVLKPDERLLCETEKINVATLNYQASKKAVSISAFESAATYARYGIHLLPQNHWTDHYELSLGLYSVGAQMAGCLGNVEEMERFCNEVISMKSIPLKDKLMVYHALIEHLRNQGKPAESANLILDILQKFGCRFQKKPVPIALGVIGNVIKIKTATKSRRIDDLPEMKDPNRFEMLKLINALSVCWYHMDDDRLPLASFRILNWTMKYGYSDYSSIAFASVAMILTGVLDDLQGGTVFGELAVKLTEKFPTSSTHARTMFLVNAFVFPWTVPLTQLQKPLLRAYDAGLKCGDPESSMWSVLIWLLSRLVVGSPLERLESDFLLYSRQMKDLKRVQQLYVAKYVRQVVLNLMGRNDGCLLEPKGESCSEAELFHCRQDNFHVPGLVMYQGILLTYFGEHIRQADAAVINGHDYLQKGYRCSLTIPFDHYLKGISCFIAAGLTKKRKYAKMAEKLRSKIKQWREMGNPNVRYYDFFLDAEYAVYKGKHFDAIRSYETTILFAARGGFQHDAAFASERLGELQLTIMKDKDEARYRIGQSIEYWRNWGALGKVRHLEKKYNLLMISSYISQSSLFGGDSLRI